MKHLSIIFVLACTASLTSGSQTKQGTELVHEYLNALRATMVQGASEPAIERLLDLYAEEIVYEHVRFGAKVEGKANARKGMLSHMGSYVGTDQETRFDAIHTIMGHNIAMVEYTQVFKGRGKNNIDEIKRRKVTFLEFHGDKIKRIADYE